MISLVRPRKTRRIPTMKPTGRFEQTCISPQRNGQFRRPEPPGDHPQVEPYAQVNGPMCKHVRSPYENDQFCWTAGGPLFARGGASRSLMIRSMDLCVKLCVSPLRNDQLRRPERQVSPTRTAGRPPSMRVVCDVHKESDRPGISAPQPTRIGAE